MNKKILSKIFIISIISIFAFSFSTSVFATQSAIDAMSNMGNATLEDGTGKLGDLLNSVIGLIQVAGTGISMVMVTMLGIKYIMAAPSDKADVKKQIAPLVIGAIILFASVNLVAIVGKLAEDTLKTAAG